MLFGDEHVRRYEETDGAEGHEWQGTTTLILGTTGRKSGQHRKNALIYQKQGDKFTAHARTATAQEKPELWSIMAKTWPAYNDYQKKTDREIPVVVLERD